MPSGPTSKHGHIPLQSGVRSAANCQAILVAQHGSWGEEVCQVKSARYICSQVTPSLTDLPLIYHLWRVTRVNRFSKSCHFLPLPEIPTALQITNTLLTHMFRHYDLPEDILLDRGSQFTLGLWQAMFSKLNINISLTSRYHPQFIRQEECTIQELGRFLCTYCQNNQSHWSKYILSAEYAQNFLPRSATGVLPFSSVLGWELPVPLDCLANGGSHSQWILSACSTSVEGTLKSRSAEVEWEGATVRSHPCPPSLAHLCWSTDYQQRKALVHHQWEHHICQPSCTSLHPFMSWLVAYVVCLSLSLYLPLQSRACVLLWQ